MLCKILIFWVHTSYSLSDHFGNTFTQNDSHRHLVTCIWSRQCVLLMYVRQTVRLSADRSLVIIVIKIQIELFWNVSLCYSGSPSRISLVLAQIHLFTWHNKPLICPKDSSRFRRHKNGKHSSAALKVSQLQGEAL